MAAQLYNVVHNGQRNSPKYPQPMTPDDCAAVVRECFRAGINFFDTSPYYGDSERNLGNALAASGVARSDFVLATKVGRYGLDKFDFSFKNVTESVHRSLELLRVSYIDIVQCHDVEFVSLQQVLDEAIPALIKLQEQGLIRHIGVTGLPLKSLKYLIERAPPGALSVALSYCHNTLLDDSLLDAMPFFNSHSIAIINGSPLSMGLLTPQGPPAWHPAQPAIRSACEAAAKAASPENISALGLKYALARARECGIVCVRCILLLIHLLCICRFSH